MRVYVVKKMNAGGPKVKKTQWDTRTNNELQLISDEILSKYQQTNAKSQYPESQVQVGRSKY